MTSAEAHLRERARNGVHRRMEWFMGTCGNMGNGTNERSSRYSDASAEQGVCHAAGTSDGSARVPHDARIWRAAALFIARRRNHGDERNGTVRGQPGKNFPLWGKNGASIRDHRFETRNSVRHSGRCACRTADRDEACAQDHISHRSFEHKRGPALQGRRAHAGARSRASPPVAVAATRGPNSGVAGQRTMWTMCQGRCVS